MIFSNKTVFGVALLLSFQSVAVLASHIGDESDEDSSTDPYIIKGYYVNERGELLDSDEAMQYNSQKMKLPEPTSYQVAASSVSSSHGTNKKISGMRRSKTFMNFLTNLGSSAIPASNDFVVPSHVQQDRSPNASPSQGLLTFPEYYAQSSAQYVNGGGSSQNKHTQQYLPVQSGFGQAHKVNFCASQPRFAQSQDTRSYAEQTGFGQPQKAKFYPVQSGFGQDERINKPSITTKGLISREERKLILEDVASKKDLPQKKLRSTVNAIQFIAEDLLKYASFESDGMSGDIPQSYMALGKAFKNWLKEKGLANLTHAELDSQYKACQIVNRILFRNVSGHNCHKACGAEKLAHYIKGTKISDLFTDEGFGVLIWYKYYKMFEYIGIKREFPNTLEGIKAYQDYLEKMKAARKFISKR